MIEATKGGERGGRGLMLDLTPVGLGKDYFMEGSWGANLLRRKAHKQWYQQSAHLSGEDPWTDFWLRLRYQIFEKWHRMKPEYAIYRFHGLPNPGTGGWVVEGYIRKLVSND